MLKQGSIRKTQMKLQKVANQIQNPAYPGNDKYKEQIPRALLQLGRWQHGMVKVTSLKLCTRQTYRDLQHGLYLGGHDLRPSI